MFIPERAPWWGGFWERLVRSVKMALKKTIGNAMISTTELITVLTESEAVINSRPLTVLFDDLNDLLPLCPNDLLIGRRPTCLPKVQTTASEAQDISRLWRKRNRLVDSFWKRWRNEYLINLRCFESSLRDRGYIGVRDVVIVKEDMVPRNQWKMARVEQVQQGRDGRVRSAMVRFASGLQTRRPVQSLYLLEANNHVSNVNYCAIAGEDVGVGDGDEGLIPG